MQPVPLWQNKQWYQPNINADNRIGAALLIVNVQLFVYYICIYDSVLLFLSMPALMLAWNL